MSPLRHIPSRFQHWVVPYVMIVLTLIAIFMVVTFKVQSSHDDDTLRAAAVNSCERANTVRAVAESAITALVDVDVSNLKDQIAFSQAIPPTLFPDIPPAQFHALTQSQNAGRRESIRRLQRVKAAARRSFKPTDCATAVPQP